MGMTAKEMRIIRKNKMRMLRQKKSKRVKENNSHAAYLMEMTPKEMRTLRKNKMRMLRQKSMKRAKEMNADAATEKNFFFADAPHLPEEVIENILTRLPLRTLAQYSCVSKLWCNLISNDARFAKSHFVHNKSNKLNLVFSFLNVWFAKGGASFFSLDKDYKFRLLMSVSSPSRTELVGYCNGFACVTLECKNAHGLNVMNVINPIRMETLSLPYNYPNDGECEYLCHGFGFESSTDEYKVVIIFTSKDNEKFVSMVLTLGTKSWRKIVTSVAQISPPSGCSPFSSRLITRAAIRCGGDLFWRINNSAVEEETIVNNNDNNKIGMLLSFDIHKEKIHFIRLPTECNPTPTQTMMNVVVEHYLLDYKGYPCVAQSKKAMRNIIQRSCRCRNGQCSFCSGCSCFTVQLYVLKDKEKKVWIKGETFGVQVRELGLLPAPFCCYCDTTTATASFSTRILCVSDQVLLHWFDGKCLKLYNLHTKHLEVVGSFSSYDELSSLFFNNKMSRCSALNGIDVGGNIYCPYMDCQLHDQAENILSLKTFIPAGETSRYYDFLQFLESQKNNLPAGWVSTARESVKFHAFF